jgi:CRP/FNR family transcriptional regulator
MEELLEGDIDRMLAKALLDSARDGKVDMTHQDLAVAIGSAREVVSRHLKRLESRQWVKLSRGSLQLINYESLETLARGSQPEAPA